MQVSHKQNHNSFDQTKRFIELNMRTQIILEIRV